MPWHTVFISHSTKNEEAQAYLDAVAEALKRQNITPLLDQKDLRGGDFWRARIYEWMAQAHGAVLLLSEEALESDFIPIEASVLAWRSFLQRDFVFVPVLIGKVTREDLKKKVLGKLYLEEIQIVEGATPELIAQKVVEALQKLTENERPRTLRQLLESNIVGYMEDANLKDRDVREVGTKFFGWSNKTDFDGLTLFEKFARDLLDLEIAKAYELLLELRTRYRMIYAWDLLNIVTPFWVMEEAATPLAQLALDVYYEKRALSLNGQDRWTAHSYISRSCYRSYEHGIPVCEIEPPESFDSVEDIKEQVSRFVLARKSAGGREFKDVIGHLEGHEKYHTPVIFLFNWLPDAPLLEELRKVFQTVTFFILTGNEKSPDKLSAIQDKVFPLKRLDNAREHEVIKDYGLVEPLLK